MLTHTMLSVKNPLPCKMIIVSILFIILFLNPASKLQATKWHTYTNTNNVNDAVITDHKIYTATWGGVSEYSLNAVNGDTYLSRVITSVDGLVSNDIRTLAYESSTGDVWAGTYNQGITVIKQNTMQILNTDSGMPSNRVRRIIENQSHLYVATDMGISQFYYLPGVSFPLLLHQYDELSTQGGLADNDVLDIAISPSGYLYCATASGVSYIHTDSLDIDTAWHNWTPSNSPIPNYPILSISVNDDYIALNTKMSVHRHNIDPNISDWQTWTRANAGLQDSVFTIGLTSQNGILLAYGLWDEDTMSIKRKSTAVYNYINSAGVLSAQAPELNAYDEFPTVSISRFILKQNALTFATWGEGLYRYFDGVSNNLRDNCIGFQTISDIKTDHNHNMWFASGWLGGTMTRKGTRGISKLSDGYWQNYTKKNSPLTIDNMNSIEVDWNNKKWFGSWDSTLEPYQWEPGVNVLDDSDNSWLWYTRDGIRTWDADDGWSAAATGSPKIYNNTISDIYVDLQGNILIASSGAGITVFDKDYNYLGKFQMPVSSGVFQSVSFMHNSGSRYFFGMNADDRLQIWNDSSLPITGENHWLPTNDYPPPLLGGTIYGVITITNIFEEEENWIASSQGLFMWDGTNWYRYDTDIKRRKYVGNDQWSNETLYYVDEERLFGSDREARPTAIFLDPFNQIWIGSLENGITMYDPSTERFTNYYIGKSPLISNYITCFGYDPIKGNLLIGTPEGLNTLEIGVQIKTEKQLNTVKAFPNPFFPNRDGAVRIINMPSQSMPKGTNVCKIFDSSGAMVIELKENKFTRFDWNGLNKKNQKCSSGIYFFVVTDANGVTKRGKIALIREE